MCIVRHIIKSDAVTAVVRMWLDTNATKGEPSATDGTDTCSKMVMDVCKLISFFEGPRRALETPKWLLKNP